MDKNLQLNIIKDNLVVFLKLISYQKMIIDDDFRATIDERYFQSFRRKADRLISGKPSTRQSTYDVINVTYESLKQHPQYYRDNLVLVSQSIENLSAKLAITYQNYPELLN